MSGKTRSTMSLRHLRQPTGARKSSLTGPSLVVSLVITGLISSVAGADHPASINRVGRWLGVGWGDGYHVCRDGGHRPGADLPPESFPDKFGAKKASAGGCQVAGGCKVYPAGTALPYSCDATGAVSCDAGCCDELPAEFTLVPDSGQQVDLQAAMAIEEELATEEASPSDLLPADNTSILINDELELTPQKTIRMPEVTAPNVNRSIQQQPTRLPEVTAPNVNQPAMQKTHEPTELRRPESVNRVNEQLPRRIPPPAANGPASPSVQVNPYLGTRTRDAAKLMQQSPIRIATKPTAPLPSGWNPIRQPD